MAYQETFVAAMRGLPSRNPRVVAVARDEYFPSEHAVQFVGETRDRYSFAVRYTPEDEEVSENLILTMVMSPTSRIPDEALSIMTYRMHRDIPGSEHFELYPSLELETDVIVLGCEIPLVGGLTIGQMDALFTSLCELAPKVGSQFFGRSRIL